MAEKPSKDLEKIQEDALKVYSDISSANPRIVPLIKKELDEIKSAAVKLVKGDEKDDSQLEKIQEASGKAITKLQASIGNPATAPRWKGIVNSVIKKLETLHEGEEGVAGASVVLESKASMQRAIMNISRSTARNAPLFNIISENFADLKNAVNSVVKADGKADPEQVEVIHTIVKDMKKAVKVYSDVATLPPHKNAAQQVQNSLDAIDKSATAIEKTIKEPKKGASLDGIELPADLPKFAVASVEQQGAPATTPLGKGSGKNLG